MDELKYQMASERSAKEDYYGNQNKSQINRNHSNNKVSQRASP